MAAAAEKYFNFDAGEVDFHGEKVVIKGGFRFEFMHKLRSPNFGAIDEIGSELKTWLENHLHGSSPKNMDTFRSLLQLNSWSTAYIQPEVYTRDQEDKMSMTKGFWLALMGIIEWLTDDLDDEKTYREDPNFNIMNKFFSSTLYKIFNLEFPQKEDLKMHVKKFGLFDRYPKFYLVFQLWYDWAMEFYEDPMMLELGVDRRKMRLLGKCFQKEYVSNSWMDGVGLEKVTNFHLYASRRIHTSAGIAQITMNAILDGFHEPELKYISLDQHVEHFTFLYIMVIALAHDLLSLKKDVRVGDTNNLVLFWVKKGRSFQESLTKAITKHDQLLMEAQSLYLFLHKEHESDPKVLEYLTLIMNNFSGICEFHLKNERYGIFKWSIDHEPHP